MALTPGTRLGSYEILSALGSGGMGEVYRAADTNLKRQVAIKVLPQAVGADPDRLVRFQREAEVLAALNHPNIAHIHGLERSDGTFALVMELVEGPTLADVLATGPIPLAEALPIAKQITEALEAAHDQGIVHRDLKPANIKVRPDGTVKVLDFGLAKAIDPAFAPGSGGVANSPTLTAHATALGMIIGTAAYMAPEQARGKAVDKRADIWAFGVVLYEMLTGRRLFASDDTSDILAAVLRQPIDWAALPANTPPRLRELLERCLDRDVRQRLRDIGEARLVLAAGTGREAAASGVASAPTMRRSSGRWLIACAACLVAGAAAAWFVVPAPPRASALRLSVTPPLASVDHVIRHLRVSPDGRRVVYWDEASPVLLVRDLGEFESRPLGGTEGGHQPFFSPDGEWVGFYAAGKLRKVPVNGGDPMSICDAATESPGAAWSPDGTIYFSPTWTAGLWKVSSGGGEPVQVTRPDRSKNETAHIWPWVLPDGRRVLFTIFGGQGLADAKVALLDLASGRVEVLFPGSRPVYLEDGHLVFFHLGGYHVVPFDAASGKVTGDARPLAEEVRPLDPVGSQENYLDAARSGRLVYVPGRASRNAPYSRVVWIDRQGRVDVLPFTDYHYTLALSPDQRHAAVARSAAGELQVWIYDLERGTRDQLTRDGTNFDPRWSPDGQRVAYTSMTRTNGSFDLRWSPADGSRPPHVLLATEQDDMSWTWLPDGDQGSSRQSRPRPARTSTR